MLSHVVPVFPPGGSESVRPWTWLANPTVLQAHVRHFGSRPGEFYHGNIRVFGGSSQFVSVVSR